MTTTYYYAHSVEYVEKKGRALRTVDTAHYVVRGTDNDKVRRVEIVSQCDSAEEAEQTASKWAKRDKARLAKRVERQQVLMPRRGE